MKTRITSTLIAIVLLTLSCKNEEKNKAYYLEKGMFHTQNATAILGKNLIGAIQRKGTSEALSFCSLNAIKLTDSISNHESVNIKRVSNKYRNPKNKANTKENKYINKVIQQLKTKGIATPQITISENLATAYYPILTNGMCLQCHGSPLKDISKQTFEKIKELYPDDLAINYKANELRGIWVIEMEKE